MHIISSSLASSYQLPVVSIRPSHLPWRAVPGNSIRGYSTSINLFITAQGYRLDHPAGRIEPAIGYFPDRSPKKMA